MRFDPLSVDIDELLDLNPQELTALHGICTEEYAKWLEEFICKNEKLLDLRSLRP